MAGTFLALYLNAKLKPFGDFHTSFWKMVAVLAPIIGAMFIAGSLVADRVSTHRIPNFQPLDTFLLRICGMLPYRGTLTVAAQNHHHHDIILSIPIGIIVGLLAYRTHYASVIDYHTNHLPLPWSGSNESLHPTVPEPSASRQGGSRNELLREKGNLAATPWPRKPKTYSYGRSRRAGETGPAAQQGLDGAVDRPSPAVLAIGGPTLRRRSGFVGVRRWRTKLARIQRQPGINDKGPNVDGSPGLRPVPDETVSGRIGVDSWADAHRESRSGRASDIV